MMRLYIDPGTGSMLFAILIGLLGTAAYFLRNVFVKLRFLLSGGAKEKKTEEDRIPYAIFSDHKRYWTTFEPICEEFEKRGEDLVYMTASPDDPALQKQYAHVRCQFIGEGNRAFAKLNFLKADVLLSTTPGLDVYQWKRSKDVRWYAHVLHMPSDATLYRMFGLDYYDAVLCSGQYQIDQIRALEKLRSLPPKDLQLVGLPYLDGLYRRSLELVGKAHPTTVLVAPSWGPSSILNKYGSRIIQALLSTGYHIVIRPHPQSFTSEKSMIEKLMQEFPEREQLEWNRDNDNFDILSRSDIMISDFSGVIFDYALVFHGPILYADTSFDVSPYDAWWLEEETWTFKILPKVGRQLKEEDLETIKALIDDTLTGTEYQEGIDQAREESWSHIGESAALIADYLIRKEKELKQQAAGAAAEAEES